MNTTTHIKRPAGQPHDDRTDNASTKDDLASPRNDALAAAVGGPTRRRRFTMILLGLTSMVATLLGTTGSASASITAPDRGLVSESVYCNSDTHTVQVNFLTAGEQGGITGDLFAHFETEQVWVIIWWWHNGSWNRTQWLALPEGASSTQANLSGTSYWYFSYAFANAAGGYDQASEWADGNGQSGWYSDQHGYHSLTACNS